MNSRILPIVSILVACASVSYGQNAPATPSPAQVAIDTASPVAISVEAGSLGAGASAWFTFNNYFSASAGFNGLGYDRDIDATDINYKGKLALSNVPVVLNLHPFKGTFRLFVGAVFGSNKVDLKGAPKAGTDYKLNGTTYTGAQIGSLSGTAKFAQGTSPMVGLGWSKAPKTKGFGMFADLGVMFTSSPKVSLSVSGPISTNDKFVADLANEVKRVNNDIEFAKYYPVIRAGLMYRF